MIERRSRVPYSFAIALCIAGSSAATRLDAQWMPSSASVAPALQGSPGAQPWRSAALTAALARHPRPCRASAHPAGFATGTLAFVGLFIGTFHGGPKATRPEARRDGYIGAAIGASLGLAVDYAAWRRCHGG